MFSTPYPPADRGFFHPGPAAYLNQIRPESQQAPGQDPNLSGIALVRFFNGSTLPFPVSLLLNRRPWIAGSCQGWVTGYDAVPGRAAEIQVLAGDSPHVLLLREYPDLASGSRTTLVLADSSRQGVCLLAFPQNACFQGSSGQCAIRAVNAAGEDLSIGLSLSGKNQLFSQIPFGSATPYLSMAPGAQTFFAQAQSPPARVPALAGSLALNLKKGWGFTLYLLSAPGSNPKLRLIPVPDWQPVNRQTGG